MEKHRKQYWFVGWLLFGCTALTLIVGIKQYYNFGEIFDFGAPGVDGPDFAVGLVIACIKASLVALIFMHLNHERGLIYKVLLFTTIFAVALMALVLFAKWNPIHEAIANIQSQFS